MITLYYANYTENNIKNKQIGKKSFFKWYHILIIVFLFLLAVASFVFLVLLKKNINKNPEFLQNSNNYTNVFSEVYGTYVEPMYSYSLEMHVDGTDNYYLPEIMRNVFENREFNISGTLGPNGGNLFCYSSDPEFCTEIIINTNGTYICPKYFGEETAIGDPSEENYIKAANCFERYKNSYIRISDGLTKNLIDSYVCSIDLSEISDQKMENDFCSIVIPDNLINRNDNFIYSFLSGYPGNLVITLHRTSDASFPGVLIEGKGTINFTIKLDECPYYIKEPQIKPEDIIEKVEY